jgi:hypothetical protein
VLGRSIVVKRTSNLRLPLEVTRSDQHLVPFEPVGGLFLQDKVIFRARLTAILTLFRWLRTLIRPNLTYNTWVSLMSVTSSMPLQFLLSFRRRTGTSATYRSCISRARVFSFNHVRLPASHCPLVRLCPSHVDEITRIHPTSMRLRTAGFANVTRVVEWNENEQEQSSSLYGYCASDHTRSSQKNMDTTIMHPTCTAVLGNASNLHCNARNARLCTA